MSDFFVFIADRDAEDLLFHRGPGAFEIEDLTVFLGRIGGDVDGIEDNFVVAHVQFTRDGFDLDKMA